jgi:NAD(P)-dependent dehydrogenase (short-subunit alcohol dehydrogenase family)
MSTDLTRAVVIVTGAAGGIGAACCQTLGRRGAAVVLVDRRREALETAAHALAAAVGGDRLLTLALDVTSETDMSEMARRTQERFGRIDALVAAAGILRTSEQPRPIADTSVDEWAQVIGVNLTGTFLSNRAVLPAMLEQGAGDIVNISSTSGARGRAFDGPYSASKFGVVGFSESLADEVGRHGVRVQALLPDAVDTAMWDQTGSAAFRPRAFLSAEQVADIVTLLISLPRDLFFSNPTVYPMPTRRRRKRDS